MICKGGKPENQASHPCFIYKQLLNGMSRAGGFPPVLFARLFVTLGGVLRT